MDLREIRWCGMDWFDVAQDRDQWRALVNSNKRSGFIKCWEFFEKLHKLGLLKNG
jgi:hypothetical protein